MGPKTSDTVGQHDVYTPVGDPNIRMDDEGCPNPRPESSDEDDPAKDDGSGGDEEDKQ